jgi:hypothetical protein
MYTQGLQPIPFRLNGRLLLLGRLLYGLLFLFCIAMFGLSLSYKFVQGTAACDTIYNQDWGEFCFDWFGAIDNLGFTAVTFESYFLILRVMAALPFFILSLILDWRRGHELRVLLFAGLLLIMGIAGTWFNPFWMWANGWFEFYAYPALKFFPRLLSYFLLNGAMLFVCLFPDGRFAPRWSRWLVGSFLLLEAGNIFFPNTYAAWGNWPAPLNTLTPLILLGLAISVIVIRYRRQATTEQRQSIRWITFGFLLMALNILIDFTVFVIYPAITGQYPLTTGRQMVLWELGQDTFAYISQFVLAICFSLAIFRYQLWHRDHTTQPASD